MPTGGKAVKGKAKKKQKKVVGLEVDALKAEESKKKKEEWNKIRIMAS